MIYRYSQTYIGGFRGTILYIACLPLYWLLFTTLVWLASNYLTDAQPANTLSSGGTLGAGILLLWVMFIDGPPIPRFVKVIGALLLAIAIRLASVAFVIGLPTFVFCVAKADMDFIYAVRLLFDETFGGRIAMIFAVPAIILITLDRFGPDIGDIYHPIAARIR